MKNEESKYHAYDQGKGSPNSIGDSHVFVSHHLEKEKSYQEKRHQRGNKESPVMSENIFFGKRQPHHVEDQTRGEVKPKHFIQKKYRPIFLLILCRFLV